MKKHSGVWICVYVQGLNWLPQGVQMTGPRITGAVQVQDRINIMVKRTNHGSFGGFFP